MPMIYLPVKLAAGAGTSNLRAAQPYRIPLSGWPDLSTGSGWSQLSDALANP